MSPRHSDWKKLQTASSKSAEEGRLLARIATNTGVPEKQVATILEALVAQVKQSLSTTGVITIPGVVRIEKKAVPDCPSWLVSLKVTVTPQLLPGSDKRCDIGLHTYYQSPATNDEGNPVCGLCGQDTIDWDRLHERNIADVAYTVAQLRTDRFRHKWWSSGIDPKAMRHATRKGSVGIEVAVRRRVYQSAGRVYRMPNGKVQPAYDGKQTPYAGNVIYYGQHATATCCRKCIEAWHGIPQGHELTEYEQDYIVALLMYYIALKLPELARGTGPIWSL